MPSPADPIKYLPSVLNARPLEEGGPIARTGFDYQDEFAVSLLIEMLSDVTMQSVLCETHDDLVICWNKPNGTVAEFVQVKGEEPFQYWSVAMLCKRSNGSGISIFEKSLGQDQFLEESRFRIVTNAPVNSDLSVLCTPVDSRDTEEKKVELTDLNEKITHYVHGYQSRKRNSTEFWLKQCFWDVRRGRESLIHANLNALMDLAVRERRFLNYTHAIEFRLKLLEIVRNASAARWNADHESKITRAFLREKWEQCSPLSSQQYGPYQKILAFQRSYLISDKGDVPFGGRLAILEELARWLSDDKEIQRALIVAPSGRGKSALLVHWMIHIQDTPMTHEWRTVFMPISMRYGTNLPGVFYHGIALQLSELLNETITPPAIDASNYYADKCTELITKIQFFQIKVLIIIDGVDEALDQSFSSLIFPEPLPPNLKIVLSARELANDKGPTGWLKKLGWQGTRDARTFDIPLLSQQNIRDLLEQIHIAPSENEEQHEIVKLLCDLTEGEPLMAMLYVEDIRQKMHLHGCYDLEYLKVRQPGFSSFIENWINDQRKAWRQENQRFDDQVIEATLIVLSCAFGPLSSTSLVRLVASVSGTQPALSTHSLIRPIERFVIGDGSITNGYVFNHPKLGQYFQESYFLDGAKLQTHRLFSAWGRETVEALNAGQLAPEKVDPYLLQHHLRHLACIDAPLLDFCGILSHQWQQAWDCFEGGYRGFSENAKTIIDFIGPLASHFPGVQQHLLARLDASLCMSTVTAFGSTQPLSLMALALDEGVINIKQALHHVELQIPENQLLAYGMIFHHLPYERAFIVVNDIASVPDMMKRAQFALTALHHAQGDLKDSLNEIIEHALATLDVTISYLVLLVDWLPYRDKKFIDTTLEVFSKFPASLNDEATLAHLYAKLIQYLAQHKLNIDSKIQKKCHEYLTRSKNFLAVINAVREYPAVLDLITVQEVIKSKENFSTQFNGLLEKQNSTDFDIRDWSKLSNIGEIYVAQEILERSKKENSEGLLDYIIALVQQIRDPYIAAQVFIENILLFPAHCKDAAFQFGFHLALSLVSGNNRTHSLLSLANKAESPIRTSLIREGLQHSILIEDIHSEALTLVSLFGSLDAERKSCLETIILDRVLKVKDYISRGELLINLSVHTVGINKMQLCVDGLHFIHVGGLLDFRKGALINVIGKLPLALQRATFSQCLQAVLAASQENDHINFWLNGQLLAEYVPDLWLEKDVLAVYSRSDQVEDFRSRAQLLGALAPIGKRYGREDIALAAFKSAEQVDEISAKARYLANAYQILSQDTSLTSNVLDFLNVVRVASEGATKARALISLFPCLPTTIKESVVNEAIEAAERSELRERNHVLLSVASIVDDTSKKDALILAARATADLLPQDARFTALTRVIPHLPSRTEQLGVLDIITSGVTLPRSTVLTAWTNMGAILHETGGGDLVVAVMQKIMSTCRTWP